MNASKRDSEYHVLIKSGHLKYFVTSVVSKAVCLGRFQVVQHQEMFFHQACKKWPNLWPFAYFIYTLYLLTLQYFGTWLQVFAPMQPQKH